MPLQEYIKWSVLANDECFCWETIAMRKFDVLKTNIAREAKQCETGDLL